jgi:hypothetical protein
MTYNVSHSRRASALQEVRKGYIALMLTLQLPARLAEACTLASSKAWLRADKANLSALLGVVLAATLKAAPVQVPLKLFRI